MGEPLEDDGLDFSTMTKTDGEDVVAFMAQHFYPREPLSTGLHMTYEDNREWIHDSVREWSQSGASVVARERASGSIVGTLLATVLTKDKSNTFDDAITSPKIKVKTLHAVLSVLEDAVDFYERYDVSKILELAMITVAEEFAGRGIGKKLVQIAEMNGKKLGCQLATAQATAIPSQKMLERLGYESQYTMDYESFEIAGERVFDMDRMLGTPSAKVMARRLSEPEVKASDDKCNDNPNP